MVQPSRKNLRVRALLLVGTLLLWGRVCLADVMFAESAIALSLRSLESQWDLSSTVSRNPRSLSVLELWMQPPGPVYQEAREWELWGSGSFLRHEWMALAPGVLDRVNQRVGAQLNQLILYRVPISENVAIYGENYSQAFWYENDRFQDLRRFGETRVIETKTVVGIERVFDDIIRVRLPVFWEAKYFPTKDPASAEPNLRHGLWVAPQIAVRTGAASELLLTISTFSVVEGSFAKWNFSNMLHTSWHHLLFRTAL